MNKKQVYFSLLQTFGAFIWGLAFVFQSSAAKYIGPYTINAIRFFLGALFLVPFSIYSLKKENKTKKVDIKTTIVAGIISGIFLIIASIVQQIGISTTSTSKSGFITAFYIVLVPIFSFLLFKKKNEINVYISILIAIVGLGFLCLKGDLSIEIGDIYLFIGALFFTFQIIAIDYFSQRVNLITMSMIQMGFASIVSFIFMMIFEKDNLDKVANAIIPLLYLGIFSSGIAYTIQVVSQKHLNPTICSLIMSLESVFSSICGIIIYSFYQFSDIPQYMNINEIIGSILMFTAVIFSQIPLSLFVKNKKNNQKNAL